MMKRVLLILIAVAAALSSIADGATIAYWRFEEGPAGVTLDRGGRSDGVFYPAVADSSGNGTYLSAWSDGSYAGYEYRTEVAGDTVQTTGAANNFSVKNTGGYPVMWTDPNSFMKTITLPAFTIEAAFKLENGGYRTIVGRDSLGANTNSPPMDGNLSALYFQAMPGNALAIKFCDISGYWHEALSDPGVFTSFDYTADPNGLSAPWYSMAATSDGATLSLYLSPRGTNHWTLIARTDMTLSGSPDTTLTAGVGAGDGWEAGNWSVGRGLYSGEHRDRAYGYIDEVRISDSALAPEQFLYFRVPAVIYVNPGDSIQAAINAAQAGDTVRVAAGTYFENIILKDGVALIGAGASVTTIDGNERGEVVFSNKCSPDTLLQGFTITNGYSYEGGGMYNYYASPTVTNCIFSDNYADFGGGMSNWDCSPTVTNCTFIYNEGYWD